jgi:hypothetical protein
MAHFDREMGAGAAAPRQRRRGLRCVRDHGRHFALLARCAVPTRSAQGDVGPLLDRGPRHLARRARLLAEVPCQRSSYASRIPVCAIATCSGLLDRQSRFSPPGDYLMGERGLPRTGRHMNGYGSHTYMWVNIADERFWVKYQFHTDQAWPSSAMQRPLRWQAPLQQRHVLLHQLLLQQIAHGLAGAWCPLRPLPGWPQPRICLRPRRPRRPRHPCTSCCCANSASVLSPRTAHSATLALNAAECVRRGLLLIFTPIITGEVLAFGSSFQTC